MADCVVVYCLEMVVVWWLLIVLGVMYYELFVVFGVVLFKVLL